MSDNKPNPLGLVGQSKPEPSTPKNPAPAPVGVGEVEPGSLRAAVVEAFKQVHDPEIPVNIYELGLIYELAIEDATAHVTMTLTAPGCPVAPQIVADVKSKVEAVEGIDEATIDLVWDPPWCADYMSDVARLALNLF